MSLPTKLITGLACVLALTTAALAEVKVGQPFPDLLRGNSFMQLKDHMFEQVLPGLGVVD